MTSQPQPPQESKIYTIEGEPWFFGHFLNLGRHNAYLILKQLQDKHIARQQPEQQAAAVDEENLPGAWVLNAAWEDVRWQGMLLEDLYHFFPFLRHLAAPELAPDKQKKVEAQAGKNVEEIPRLLKEWLQHLNQLRNALVHYPPRPWQAGFSLKEPQKLEQLRNDIPTLLLQRYPQTFSEADVAHLKNERYYRPFADEGELTPQGLYLFTCLWLSRRQANEFFNHIKYFKDTREARYRATRYGFALYCARPPEPRVTSSHPALDILAELERIPQALYRLLQDEYKKNFQVQPEDTDAPDTDDTLSTPLMIRKRDRFPHFALAFFERNPGLLGKMRFHLKLGQVVMATYDKEEGEIGRRILVRDIFAWGFPEHFQNPERVGVLHQKGWLEKGKLATRVQQYRPRYHLTDFGIGLRFEESWPTGAEAWPDIRPEHFRPAPAPHAILPAKALPSLLAWELLRYRHPEWDMPPASELLERAWQNMHRFFTDVENGAIQPVNDERQLATLCSKYGIDPADLPRRLKGYLLGSQPRADEQQRARKWLENKKIETNRLIKRLTAQRKRLQEDPDQRPFLRAGDMATWLARDICYFQHPEGHQLNNDEYRDLQATLAYFGKNGKDEVMRKLEALGLTGQPGKDHPFLYKLRRKTSIRGVLGFYRAYLDAKMKWLDDQMRKLRREKRPDDYLRHVVPPLRTRQQPPHMTGYPVVLPPDLLRRQLAAVLANHNYAVSPHDSLEKILSQLEEWEPPQTFYGLPREYRIRTESVTYAPAQTDFAGFAKRFKAALARALANGEGNERHANELIELGKKLWKRINHTEKLLRRYALQDRLLWWLARTLLEQDNEQIDIKGWKLQHLGFDQPGSPMQQEVTFNVKVTDAEGQAHEISATMRPRHYGKMQRALRDRRVPGLLTWFAPEQPLTFDALRAELERTATRQDEVLQKVYALEEATSHAFKEEDTPARESNDKISHSHYLDVLMHEGLLSEKEKEHLRNLRNRFSHNEVPARSELPLWQEENVGHADGQTVMDWLVDKSVDLYDNIIGRILEYADKNDIA